ncbi:hypothetical protein AB0D86_01240 [Streptomyces sp. NPDC048324]|uniref:hypothetical protein n=1 Tax=Streptomyces sp. NPDC048324 TaxID=3157205 RepID=UPI00341E1D9F
MISYDLKKPGQDYTTLIKEIKSLGSWCHALKSTWLVDTLKSSQQVHSALRAHMDSNDLILVVNITNDDHAGYLDDEVVKWIRQHM